MDVFFFKYLFVLVKEKPKPELGASNSPKSLADLEIRIVKSATAAIKAYHQAETALKDYNQDVDVIVEESVDRINPDIWKSLKKKTEAKNEILNEAIRNTKSAMKDLEMFKKMLNDPSIDAPETAKATARRNADRMMDDIKKAKEDYENVRRSALVTEKYWQKVETARTHFVEELEILFPDFEVSKQKFHMQPSDLDLFILHAFANVLYLQKELNNLDMIGQKKLDTALQNAKKGDPNFSIVETAIMEGIDKEKRKLCLDFKKKVFHSPFSIFAVIIFICLTVFSPAERIRARTPPQVEMSGTSSCGSFNGSSANEGAGT